MAATLNSILRLCKNKDALPESDLVSRLKAMQIDPNVLAKTYSQRTGDEGIRRGTLLHFAARFGRSPEFCKEFVDLDANLVKTADANGFLPIHHACNREGIDLDTVKYFFEIYPESINIQARGEDGDYFLHMLLKPEIESSMNEFGEIREIARGGTKAMLIEFILEHDSGVLSTQNGYLKLLFHRLCELHYDSECRDVIRLILDAHPEFILLALQEMDQVEEMGLVDELKLQCEAVLDRVPDGNGQLPIHRVISTRNATLCAIKLMIAANPDSTAVADSQGCIPLHLACRFGTLKIVKYLVGLIGGFPTVALDTVDHDGNLPLHHACLGGKLDIVNYILEVSPGGVTVSNTEAAGGKLPITVLLYDADCDRDQYYVDTVDSLLRANPKDSLANLSPGLFKRGE
eukprot:scaffold21568_cov33-Cyclotella_meneghiniana.AAC.1